MIGYNKLDATNEQIQNSFINQGKKKEKHWTIVMNKLIKMTYKRDNMGTHDIRDTTFTIEIHWNNSTLKQGFWSEGKWFWWGKKKYQNCYIIPDLWENMSLVLHFTQLPTKEDTTK